MVGLYRIAGRPADQGCSTLWLAVQSQAGSCDFALTARVVDWAAHGLRKSAAMNLPPTRRVVGHNQYVFDHVRSNRSQIAEQQEQVVALPQRVMRSRS